MVVTHTRIFLKSAPLLLFPSVGGKGVTVVMGDGTILLDSFVVLASAYSHIYTHGQVKSHIGTGNFLNAYIHTCIHTFLCILTHAIPLSKRLV